MRLLWLLLSVATGSCVLAAEPEVRLQQSGTLKGARSNPGSPVLFSPNGQSLAFISKGQENPGFSVVVWDLTRREAVVTFDGATDHLGSPAFSLDGKTLAAACDGEGSTMVVKLWDMATKKEYASLKGAHGPLAFSSDGKTLASGGKNADETDRGLKLWDVGTRKHTAFLAAHKESRLGLDIRCVAFSPDAQRIATGTGGFAKDGQRLGGTLKLWDAATGKEIAVLRDGIFPSSVAFSPDSKHLASADLLGHVQLWDGKSGQRTATLQTYDPRKGRESGNPTYSVAFSPDGKTLAAGTMKGVKLWDVQGGNQALAVDGPEATVWSVAFSPDGKALVTAGTEKGAGRPDFENESTVRLWRCLSAKKDNK